MESRGGDVDVREGFVRNHPQHGLGLEETEAGIDREEGDVFRRRTSGGQHRTSGLGFLDIFRWGRRGWEGVSRRHHGQDWSPESISAMWMGSEVVDGVWKLPEEGSLWWEAFSRLRLTKYAPQQVQISCRTACEHWDTSGFAKKPNQPEVSQAALQCAPGVFVPGTQKGASTFLFHAISWHPQVVQPLRGSHGFKETGRYLPQVAANKNKLGLRMAGFPFLEEQENFISGDGTVTYMSHDKSVPRAIFADNSHAKVVFALRDPVARAWSDYRFLFGNYANKNITFSEVVTSSLSQVKTCFQGHEQVERFFTPNMTHINIEMHKGYTPISDADKEGIDHFYSSCSSTGDGGQLVRKGLYFFQVLHWVSVFGVDNVIIVDSADLKTRQKETLEGVYKFLGLCPVDISRLEPENVTRPPPIPKHMAIDEKAFQELQDFYRPFNKKLYELMRRDLGWESNTFASSVKVQ
ncbi:unnamed protein product [Choristocarpus tenellus]